MENLVWGKMKDSPTIKSHAQTAANTNEVQEHTPTTTHNEEPQTITHKDEKIALVLALASGFAIWNTF